MQHVFIIGSKGLGNYGGYETFVNKLTEYHQDCTLIKYHIACKANGDGYMDETKLDNIEMIGENEFIYHNAHCFKITVPSIGPAQAIYYDLAALKYCIDYCKKNNIIKPIIYVLACRIGPFIGVYKKKIKQLDGLLLVNPDGHEWKRAKWSAPIRKYWKISEAGMVKHADLLVCDSVNIEKYIEEEYKRYNPRTTFIAYGSDIEPSKLSDNDDIFISWLNDKGLIPHEYYLVVGRFVPENNYETMIKEFMKSNTTKNFAIITNVNDKFLEELENKLHYKNDQRIKFVGTVYNQELLKKIRENAYAYFHGHEVGGTNPSLLEALGYTNVNLLLDVGFNREVALDSALYWSKKDNDLKELINSIEQYSSEDCKLLGKKAKSRIRNYYSWQLICEKYKQLYCEILK